MSGLDRDRLDVLMDRLGEVSLGKPVMGRERTCEELLGGLPRRAALENELEYFFAPRLGEITQEGVLRVVEGAADAPLRSAATFFGVKLALTKLVYREESGAYGVMTGERYYDAEALRAQRFELSGEARAIPPDAILMHRRMIRAHITTDLAEAEEIHLVSGEYKRLLFPGADSHTRCWVDSSGGNVYSVAWQLGKILAQPVRTMSVFKPEIGSRAVLDIHLQLST